MTTKGLAKSEHGPQVNTRDVEGERCHNTHHHHDQRSSSTRPDERGIPDWEAERFRGVTRQLGRKRGGQAVPLPPRSPG